MLRTEFVKVNIVQDQIQRDSAHWGYAMLMSPFWAPGCDEDETAVNRCRIRSGELAVRMRKVLFIPWSW